MGADASRGREIGLIVGRVLAAAAILGIAWLAGRGTAIADLLAALQLHSSLPVAALGQDVPLRTVVGRGIIGFMAGILTKVALPHTTSPRMLFCVAAGLAAEALIASLGGSLGVTIAPDVSVEHVGFTAGATALLLFAAHLVWRF